MLLSQSIKLGLQTFKNILMLDFIFLDFHWTQLLQPQWYIANGGLWLLLFVVFAETGLFAGFFLPGDSLFLYQVYMHMKLYRQIKQLYPVLLINF